MAGEQIVQIYVMTPCGHVRYLALMPAPECPICRDIETWGEMTAGLLRGNPDLTIEEARNYSARILDAESREDYITMHKLIQEALYGKGRNTA